MLLTCAALLALPLPGARAADISIIGKWEFVEAVPAPWSKPTSAAALKAEGNRMLKTEVTFAKGSVKSKFKPFDCKSKVIYTPNAIEVDALFQGNLPEPNPAAAAARLGFPRGDIPGVDVRCLKAQYTFHFRDADTAMINLNGVIYTLKRQ
jgi:hypothetical protein